ncbi:type VI secretion system contractile sheath large subunit [Methylobacterium sp. Leaf100]|uniref:type VI secretion system contractile sheath large subunit n=1 Tax=Methylobacterium sp. Leaf100 TaxID=1736252 RepID=UPI000A958757|nr:type VI secretion system contractile sheath large subunit [Methylobacterium sp. Leaf100]
MLDADRAQPASSFGGMGQAAPSDGAAARRQADRLVALIDRALNTSVNAILHHAEFQAFEARWRGLAYLVGVATETGDVQVKLLSVSWRDLCRDFERAVEFDQSRLFELVYAQEFGMPGGEPFGLLLGDYAVGHRFDPVDRTDDIAALKGIAGVAAAAFAPFLTALRPETLAVDAFTDLDGLPQLGGAFDGPDFLRWKSLRETEDCRFLGILAPRVLMRRPHRAHHRGRVDGFPFEEDVRADGHALLWGSPIYAFARVVLRAFGLSGWFADLRGAPQDQDGGGLVTDLPTLSFGTDRPGLAAQPPVEIRLTASQERQLSDHGIIPVGWVPFTASLVFNANPSLHRPPHSLGAAAEENARLAAMLQYVLCAARFAHTLKVMMRDQVGRLGDAPAVERLIVDWLARYRLGNDTAAPELKARYPLRDAGVEVREIPGRPGVLGCTLRLQPHFQLDDVAASFQLVAEVTTAQSGA